MATDAFCDDPVSLVCKFCDKSYQHEDGPLMLPCLHSFCKPCLEEHIKKEPTDGNKMACPTCNDRFLLPGDINQFPVNLRLSHLAEATIYEEQAEGGKVKCQKCKSSPKDATSFSSSRCMFLCDDCKSNYQEYGGDKDEEFIDLAAYKKGELKVHLPPPKCSQHKKHDLELFCNDCKTLICLYCSQTNHQDHKKSSFDDIVVKEKAELQQLTNGVDRALGTMDQTLQQIQDMRDKVKVSAKEATNRIDEACDELIQAVENRREVLKRKCQEIAEGKDDVLSNQMVEVQHLRKNLGFAHLHATDAVNNHSAEEILKVKKAIEVRLNRVMEAYQRQSMELKEDGSINTLVEIGSLVEEIQKVGSFPSVPDPSKCRIEGMAASVGVLGEEKKLVVVLMDEAEKPVEGTCHFQYQLKKVGEDPDEYIPPKATVTQSNNNDGTATLGFTPDQPGEYELTIMVRNKPITDPYKMACFERRSRDYYSHFQNMPVTYKNVGGYCHGIAVHDDGTVYATNYHGHTIKVFKPDGTESVIGGSDSAGGQLSRPWGIVLVGDTIYVVSWGNHMVKMYSTNGKFIGGFGGEGSENGQLNYPLGICTDGKERILVADQKNDRIQIFTSEGNFIKSIQCPANPQDIAVDPVGNIHVALFDNNHIAVYSEDGKQIETYNLEGRLQYPTGIHVDGEGNRLIGTNNKGVFIADPTGTLIASRQVDKSWGVTMDKSGLIFVTETSNRRVSVFY